MFHAEDPKVSDDTVRSLVARVTWRFWSVQ